MWCVNGELTLRLVLLGCACALWGIAGLVVSTERQYKVGGWLVLGASLLVWATQTGWPGVWLCVGVGAATAGAWQLCAPAVRPRARFAREKGQSLIEFALVLPILLLLIIGIFEFGRVFLEYYNLVSLTQNAAQAAARLGGHGPGVELVMQNNHLPPVRIEDVKIQVDTLAADDGSVLCDGAVVSYCQCEYGDVIRTTTAYPTRVRILGFREDLTLRAKSTLFCWRGGAP